MMKLELLKTFVRVAELGSLTKAAAAMDTMQSVISRSISSFERDIGGRLFHRTGRGVKLSPLGESLLPRARQVLREADEFMADAREATGIPSGEVRVGLLSSLTIPLVGMLLDRVRKEYPGINLKIFEGTTGRLDEWLVEGRIDVSMNFRDSKTSLGDERHIANVDTYLIGKPNDRLLARQEIDFDRLDGIPLILSATPSGLRVMLDRLASQHGIMLNPVIEADSVALHLQLVMQGFGYAIMTPQAISEVRRTKSVGVSKIVNPRLLRSITLGTSTRQVPSLPVRKVVALITGLAGELVASGDWEGVEFNSRRRPKSRLHFSTPVGR